MAAWISVIIETAWHSLDARDDQLTAVVLEALGPSLLIGFIFYRLIVGRALVDQGGRWISVASIALLVGIIYYLHKKPASRTHGFLHDRFVNSDSKANAVDPMTPVVVCTTAIVFVVAFLLCIAGNLKRTHRCLLAGAAILSNPRNIIAACRWVNYSPIYC